MASNFVLNPRDGEQARAGREVDQEVQVTALMVVASGNAAEDACVPDSVTLKHLAQLLPAGGHEPTSRAAQRHDFGWRGLGHAPIVAGSDLPVRTPLAPVG